ncbi:MAG: NAD(P)-dependent glycerol-3-phosphate dehydrogenase [Coriobacteriales bacterium]|jgi:glycerol-3-phosphate dehydrogenase (NAD(P)+)|nr:NAD(P)-dependent glycerol-3-phosphate dehydrogenase [Coriobacteriales bacterium]
MRIAVIGAGSWGSAVARLLGTKETEVNLWARNPELAQEINETKSNPRYLSGVAFPQTVTATSDLAEALNGAEAVVFATPSKAVREMAHAIASNNLLTQDTPTVILSKGIEHETGLFLLDVLADELGNKERLAVLSGPNHAEEVARDFLSATLIAAQNEEVARFFQEALTTPQFRVYTSTDVTGVQLCGAAKNVIAIAAGVVAGKGLGDNTMAMIITRGLAEISRLVEAAGGLPQTCMGLAGMGDLIVTCTSEHSRNRSFGVALAQGISLEEYERTAHMVVEGALACRTIPQLAKKYDVEMPISNRVYDVVWGEQQLDDMIVDLMGRPAKPEFY